MIKLTDKAKISIFVISTFLLSYLIFWIFNKDIALISSWIFVIPNVITIEAIVIYFFKKILWKVGFINRFFLLPPNLNGTWIGEIHSNYIDKTTKKRLNPIPCMLNFSQTYSQVHVKLLTGESVSVSFSEEILIDKDTNTKRLTYSYTNDPKVLLDKRSKNHKGTMIFHILDNNRLEGEYFTSRKTKGEIYVNFYSKRILDSLPNDINEHPMVGK